MKTQPTDLPEGVDIAQRTLFAAHRDSPVENPAGRKPRPDL
jgi:hypothetical protein